MQLEIEELYYVYLNEPELQRPDKWLGILDTYYNFSKMLMFSHRGQRFLQIKRSNNKMFKQVSDRLGQSYKWGGAKEHINMTGAHEKL